MRQRIAMAWRIRRRWRGIIAQVPAVARHRRAQLDEIAVEILAAAHLETSLVIALQQLAEAHRVGHRHQLDHAVEQALASSSARRFFSSQAVRMPGSSSACRLAWM
jgi:hypothetical protein